MATAHTHRQLTFGRALAGVAVGVSTSLSALYISECAPARARGRLSSLAPLAGTSGILLSYLASLALRDVAGGWRLMLALCAVPAAAQLALGRYLVESPRWLAERGRTSDARRALVALGQPDADPSTFVRTSDVAAMASSDWRVLWRPKYRRATTAAVGLNLLQQLCGINVVVYFAPAILSDAGFDRSASIALTAGVGALQIACGARLSAVIDRVGRRPAALWGIVGLGAGLACLAAGATTAAATDGGGGFDGNLRRRREVDRGGRHTHLPSEFQLFVGPRAVRGGGGGVSERGSRERRGGGDGGAVGRERRRHGEFSLARRRARSDKDVVCVPRRVRRRVVRHARGAARDQGEESREYGGGGGARRSGEG